MNNLKTNREKQGFKMTEKRYILSHNGKEDGIRDKTNDKGYYGFELARLVNELSEENEQLKSVNMEMEDCLGRLEEEKIKLEIKLQKIRDYAKEDGEVKQGIIEKVILNG